MNDIRFPHLGIHLHNVGDGFSLFGIEIRFYGLLIAIGFLIATIVVCKEAKRTGQDDNLYIDYILWMCIPAMVGARLFYVIFSWSEYFQKGKGFGQTLKDIINIRNGGLAIYGGIIAAIIVAWKFAKKKEVKFSLLADTAVMSLLIGQIIGRWGNFFNREAFGDYTNSLLAMHIPIDYYGSGVSELVGAGVITNTMAEHVELYDGMQWISVHPTFLYESLWNLALLIFIIIYRKHKKFDGELALMYLWGYGLGRVWIEALRTDSLLVPGIHIRVSQLIAALCVLVASIILVKKRLDYGRNLPRTNNVKN